MGASSRRASTRSRPNWPQSVCGSPSLAGRRRSLWQLTGASTAVRAACQLCPTAFFLRPPRLTLHHGAALSRDCSCAPLPHLQEWSGTSRPTTSSSSVLAPGEAAPILPPTCTARTWRRGICVARRLRSISTRRSPARNASTVQATARISTPTSPIPSWRASHPARPARRTAPKFTSSALAVRRWMRRSARL